MPRESVTVTKNSLLVPATSTLLEIMVSSSIKTILLFDYDLSKNFLLSATSEMSRLLQKCLFSLRNTLTQEFRYLRNLFQYSTVWYLLYLLRNLVRNMTAFAQSTSHEWFVI